MKLNEIVFDLPILRNSIDRLIDERTLNQMIRAELVEPQDIRKREAYNRFRDLEKKAFFQQRLINELHEQFISKYDLTTADQHIIQFQKMAQNIEHDGAITLGNMIDFDSFSKLISSYDKHLSTDGSQSWIHSYINFGNYPEFLTAPQFHHAFLHPLLIALIAYSSGGPIRIVDARGKDAEPLAVQAQDNMLHIDNTPFRKEFKIIVTWERGKVSGPKGQNFVFIPGTHQGVRNCKISDTGEAWSTEDGSIFTTPQAVDAIFALQEKVMPGESPAVVEVTHPDMPLTTLFRAGELIHHRYRTLEKNIPRSCVILAFHRAEDNPGQFLAKNSSSENKNSLPKLLMSHSKDITEDVFITGLVECSTLIANKLQQISKPNLGDTQQLPYEQKKLKLAELQQWKATVTGAPTVEAIKIKANLVKLGGTISKAILLEMMKYDKHGPLDLILYEDGHEEIRKWARNRIREMPLSRLESRLNQFDQWDLYQPLEMNDLLQPKALGIIAKQLLHYITEIPSDLKLGATLSLKEKITVMDAFRSVNQLIADLGEAIERCTSRQTFLSTSLFLLFACDDLHCLLIGDEGQPVPELLKLTQELMHNYLATYILIEKQIEMEQQKAVQFKASNSPRYQFLPPVESFPPQPPNTTQHNVGLGKRDSSYTG